MQTNEHTSFFRVLEKEERDGMENTYSGKYRLNLCNGLDCIAYSEKKGEKKSTSIFKKVMGNTHPFIWFFEALYRLEVVIPSSSWYSPI